MKTSAALARIAPSRTTAITDRAIELRAAGKEPNSKTPWLATVPVVALTANAMLEDRHLCLDAGMNDYLSKPINMEAVQACLGRWLGNGDDSAKL